MLVDVQNYLRYFYILVVLNRIFWFLCLMDFVGSFKKFSHGYYIVWTFLIDIIKLRNYELIYSVLEKFLISTKFAIVIVLLWII